MNRKTITSYLNHYFANCGQNPADWDIKTLTDSVDQYLEQHQLSDVNDIPEDDFTQMLIDNAVDQQQEK